MGQMSQHRKRHARQLVKQGHSREEAQKLAELATLPPSTGKLVIVVDVAYNQGKFRPELRKDGSDGTDLCDVAMFVDCRLCEHTDRLDGDSAGYILSNPTVYSLKGFLADLADGKIKPDTGIVAG